MICLHSLRNVQENHSSFLHFFQMMSPEHLTCGWLLHLLLVFLKPCGAPAGPARPLNGSDCTARGPAAYLLVFTGQWSPQAFPKQYPLFRPPAQWSKLMGKSHCCEVITGNPSADGEHRPFFFFCSFVRGLNYQTHTFTLQTETLGWGPPELSVLFPKFPDIAFFSPPHCRRGCVADKDVQ